MKRHQKSLQLNRETLRPLSQQSKGLAGGGTYGSCAPYISICLCANTDSVISCHLC